MTAFISECKKGFCGVQVAHITYTRANYITYTRANSYQCHASMDINRNHEEILPQGTIIVQNSHACDYVQYMKL